MISVPNVALFFFMPHPPIEAVLLLIANQAMASIFLLGGLLMSFLVPFKMVKSAKLHPVHQEAQTQFVIPIPPAAEQPVSMNSTLGSFPETPRSSRFQQPSLPRTPVSRPAFFAEAEQERSPTQTGSIFPPPLYKAY